MGEDRINQIIQLSLASSSPNPTRHPDRHRRKSPQPPSSCNRTNYEEQADLLREMEEGVLYEESAININDTEKSSVHKPSPTPKASVNESLKTRNLDPLLEKKVKKLHNSPGPVREKQFNSKS